MGYVIAKDFDEFPYLGQFFYKTVDTTKSLVERSVGATTITYEYNCDIQLSGVSREKGVSEVVYEVFIRETDIPVKRGWMFKGLRYNKDTYSYDTLISGRVVSNETSQLGSRFKVEVVDV